VSTETSIFSLQARHATGSASCETAAMDGRNGHNRLLAAMSAYVALLGATQAGVHKTPEVPVSFRPPDCSCRRNTRVTKSRCCLGCAERR
jgi:hypothetical protein